MKIKTLQECQKAHLLMVLQKTAWDLDKTARLLQVPLARVKEKIRQYGLKNAAGQPRYPVGLFRGLIRAGSQQAKMPPESSEWEHNQSTKATLTGVRRSMPTFAEAPESESELTYTRFDRMSEQFPSCPAVIYLGERFSYRRLRALSDRFAGALAAMEVGKGDRVMIYIANSIQWVIAFLGIQKIGAVVVPVSPIYTSHEIAYMIEDAGVETVVCMDANFCYVRETFDKTRIKRVIVTNLADLLPPWKRILGTLFDKIPKGKVEPGERVHTFRALLRHAPLEKPVPPWACSWPSA